MVLFNHATREMTAKIVYYGPGLCGKTTNLLVIYDKLETGAKGKMLSLATRSDRTLFFDLLPVELGKVGTFSLKIQLYTVPGQVFYNETRKLVLRGADSVVFVVDSQPSLLDSNRESFDNLLENLRENKIDPEDLPIVVQYNKRDIPGVLSVRQIQKRIGLDRYPSIEASAINGEGVMETFKLVSRLTAKKLLQRMNGKKEPEEADRAAAGDGQPAQDVARAGIPPEEQRLPEDLAEQMHQVSSRFSVANIAAADAGPTLARGDVAAPFEEQYDKMEEVSLEQLLEGRDRPLTLRHADVPAPPEEIEHLTEEDLVTPSATDPSPSPAAASPEPATEVRDEVEALRSQIAELQQRQDQIVSTLSRVVSELTSLLNR